jgi:hypothetical protein
VNRARLIVVAVWLLGVGVYALIYIGDQLRLDPPDEYARTWTFQLMAFALVRFPFLLVVLGLLLWLLGRRSKVKTLND